MDSKNNTLLDAAKKVFEGEIETPIKFSDAVSNYTEHLNVSDLDIKSIDCSNILLYRENILNSVTVDSLDRFGNKITGLSGEVIESFVAKGGTLILVDAHNSHQLIEDTVKRLKCIVDGNIWANLFITYLDDGIDAHWDDNDVFILQITGSRQWNIWDPEPKLPTCLSKQVANMPSRQPTLKTILRKGDLLVIPRGWIHEANLIDESSVHLMIAVRRPTVLDYLKVLLEHTSHDEIILRENVVFDETDRIKQMKKALDTAAAYDTANPKTSLATLLKKHNTSDLSAAINSIL